MKKVLVFLPLIFLCACPILPPETDTAYATEFLNNIKEHQARDPKPEELATVIANVSETGRYITFENGDYAGKVAEFKSSSALDNAIYTFGDGTEIHVHNYPFDGDKYSFFRVGSDPEVEVIFLDPNPFGSYIGKSDARKTREQDDYALYASTATGGTRITFKDGIHKNRVATLEYSFRKGYHIFKLDDGIEVIINDNIMDGYIQVGDNYTGRVEVNFYTTFGDFFYNRVKQQEARKSDGTTVVAEFNETGNKLTLPDGRVAFHKNNYSADWAVYIIENTDTEVFISLPGDYIQVDGGVKEKVVFYHQNLGEFLLEIKGKHANIVRGDTHYASFDADGKVITFESGKYLGKTATHDKSYNKYKALYIMDGNEIYGISVYNYGDSYSTRISTDDPWNPTGVYFYDPANDNSPAFLNTVKNQKLLQIPEEEDDPIVTLASFNNTGRQITLLDGKSAVFNKSYGDNNALYDVDDGTKMIIGYVDTYWYMLTRVAGKDDVVESVWISR